MCVDLTLKKPNELIKSANGSVISVHGLEQVFCKLMSSVIVVVFSLAMRCSKSPNVCARQIPLRTDVLQITNTLSAKVTAVAIVVVYLNVVNVRVCVCVCVCVLSLIHI